jgi:hypothetical protein
MAAAGNLYVTFCLMGLTLSHWNQECKNLYGYKS